MWAPIVQEPYHRCIISTHLETGGGHGSWNFATLSPRKRTRLNWLNMLFQQNMSVGEEFFKSSPHIFIFLYFSHNSENDLMSFASYPLKWYMHLTGADCTVSGIIYPDNATSTRKWWLNGGNLQTELGSAGKLSVVQPGPLFDFWAI